MAKKKLIFIDHSFHQQTKSSDFFREILSPYFDLETVWDKSWRGHPSINLTDFESDVQFIFWQIPPTISQIRWFGSQIVWVPMYDNETVNPLRLDKKYYYQLLAHYGVKVISFSQCFSVYLTKQNLLSLNVKYFPSPCIERKKVYAKVVYFWDRGDINFGQIKKVLGDQKIDQFIYRVNLDPGRENALPSKDETGKYHIKLIQGETNKADHERYLNQANIFIAPRHREGIGMTFLEALAKGLVVIANNDATMNEYIVDGENGFLTNWQSEIRLENLDLIQNNAFNTIREGQRAWLKNRKEIIKYIQKPSHPTRIRLSSYFLISRFTLFRELFKFASIMMRILNFKAK